MGSTRGAVMTRISAGAVLDVVAQLTLLSALRVP